MSAGGDLSTCLLPVEICGPTAFFRFAPTLSLVVQAGSVSADRKFLRILWVSLIYHVGSVNSTRGTSPTSLGDNSISISDFC